MADRPNFYLLLDLDPSVDDWQTVEGRIREKRSIWARDSTMASPRRRREARRNLELLSELLSTLRSPETRRREAASAQDQSHQRERMQLAELEEAIEVLAVTGNTISPQQIALLQRRFQNLVSPVEVEQHLATRGIRVRSPDDEKLDPTLAANIRRNLDLLKLDSLYDFLNLERNASAIALRKRADAIYRENQRLGRTDVNTSCRNELAGLCTLVFKDSSEKEKYDHHIWDLTMEFLKPHLELAGAGGLVSESTLETLIQMAKQRGVPERYAREFFHRHAATASWTIHSPTSTGPESTSTLSFIRKITNVSSKSFGVVVHDDQGREVVANLIQRDDVVPCSKAHRLDTREDVLHSLEVRCMESSCRESRVELSQCNEIGRAALDFGRPLPEGSQVEIAFHLGADGLLTITGKELIEGKLVCASFQTGAILSKEGLETAKRRNLGLAIGSGTKTRSLQRDHIFISYSRQDRDWLNRFKVMLKPILRSHPVSIWDDTQISPGANWKKEIEHAVATAKVAILLVSANFLHSDFIHENELLPLLRAAEAEREGPKVIWVCLTHCLFEVTELRYLQAAHNPQRPLSDLRKSEKERVLAEIGRYIQGLFASSPR
jgi:hypothetical protein